MDENIGKHLRAIIDDLPELDEEDESARFDLLHSWMLELYEAPTNQDLANRISGALMMLPVAAREWFADSDE